MQNKKVTSKSKIFIDIPTIQKAMIILLHAISGLLTGVFITDTLFKGMQPISTTILLFGLIGINVFINQTVVGYWKKTIVELTFTNTHFDIAYVLLGDNVVVRYDYAKIMDIEIEDDFNRLTKISISGLGSIIDGNAISKIKKQIIYLDDNATESLMHFVDTFDLSQCQKR